jgi:hypothetical protein
MAVLQDKLHGRIQTLCKQGDAFADKGNYQTALEQYWAAWDLLREPKTAWEAGTL